MLNTNKAITGWLLAMIIFITSCKQSAPEQTEYIPKDASVVLSINPEQMQKKLSGSNISLDSLLRSAFTDDAAFVMTENDIKTSGIDMSKDIYAFVNQSGSMMSGTTVTSGMVAILNKAAEFETFLKKKMPAAQLQKGDGFSYAILKNNFVAGWNEDVVIVNNVMAYNTTSGEQTATASDAQKALTLLFTQKKEASLASVDQFQKTAGNKADLLFWSNSNSALSTVPMIGMSKASDLFKNTYTAGTVNFENGKVDMDITTYPNEVLSDTLKKYAGPKVDLSLLDHYPGAANGFALFSFDPKLLIAILDFIGIVPTANQFLQNQGFTLDDITQAFKGDFAVVFSNITMEQKEIEGYKYNAPAANIIISASIGDKAKYDKIIAQLANKGLMEKQPNGQYVPSFMAENPNGFTMYSDAKRLMFASNPALLQQYQSGSAKVSLPSGVYDKAKGSSTAFYVDIATILSAFPRRFGQPKST